MHPYRTHTCGALRAAHVGETVRLSGWVHRKRDHGGLLFIDLRDHYGLTQVVADAGSPLLAKLDALRPESVITVSGQVVARAPETVNANLETGEVEVRVRELGVQSMAEDLPLPVFGEQEYPEEIRLKYRFLDLRREHLHKSIMLRSAIIASIRRRMIAQGFTEFQTPILTASSPEGARDYLVPSRLHPGKFYALPQAPQQFKQLIMVAGFDRYFQIAPCFRDEDARADRSPGEFYQLDLEMSFVEQEDVFQAVEPVIHGVFEEFAGRRKLGPRPFPRIPFAEALLKYGTDKPDLRNPLVITDVTAPFQGSNFRIFARAIEGGAVVRAIPAPGAAWQPRSFFDKLNEWARSEGAGGLGYIIFDADGPKGPVANNLGAERAEKIRLACNLKPGDAVFFACDKVVAAASLAGKARIRLGGELGLNETDAFRFCWIVDFPMYEYDEQEKKIVFSHNPFSMPQGGLEALNSMDPLEIKAFQYDIVCNGVELSSGAIRNHRPDVMLKAFAIAGYTKEEVETRFAGMLNAFRYGAPPHGGIAPGIDRIVMLLADVPNLREVILFPMNQRAEDLMMGAPATVSAKQLRELNIRVVEPPKG
jgi:aspartyl-tRNA synthetase